MENVNKAGCTVEHLKLLAGCTEHESNGVPSWQARLFIPVTFTIQERSCEPTLCHGPAEKPLLTSRSLYIVVLDDCSSTTQSAWHVTLESVLIGCHLPSDWPSLIIMSHTIPHWPYSSHEGGRCRHYVHCAIQNQHSNSNIIYIGHSGASTFGVYPTKTTIHYHLCLCSTSLHQSHCFWTSFPTSLPTYINHTASLTQFPTSITTSYPTSIFLYGRNLGLKRPRFDITHTVYPWLDFIWEICWLSFPPRNPWGSQPALP